MLAGIGRRSLSAGRDHWGHVFSFALAGAGIRGGQVIGASDKNGAYPATDPITGGDLTATIFHLLGIDPADLFSDKANRPHPITKGEPIAALLGNTLVTAEHCRPGGDPAFVPPYDTSLLLDTDFSGNLPLVAPAPQIVGVRVPVASLRAQLIVTSDTPASTSRRASKQAWPNWLRP